MKIIFFLLCSLAALSHQKRSYKGYQVFETEEIHSRNFINDLIKFVESAEPEAYDFWSIPRTIGSRAKMMTAPEYKQRLVKFLTSKGIGFKKIIPDVEMFNLKSEEEQNLQKKERRNQSDPIDWNNYYGLEDIYKYLDSLEQKYDYVSVQTYGKSFKKRDLKLLKIAKAGEDAPNVLIEAGIHAREWIAPAMATYLMHSLLNVEENAHYLDKLNFHIIPSANPDGYEYSRVFDRLWRKTRSRREGHFCVGVDPNRNWGFHWNETGVNDKPCSNIYPGPSAFSESETEAIKNYSEKLSPTPILSLSLHSAANLWLVPFGYDYDAFPPNYDELMGLAEEAVIALREVYGTEFTAIHSPDLYPASGGSHDWYIGALGSRFSYTVELRQGGIFGFDLPLDQIEPSGIELWEAMRVVLNKMHEVSKSNK